MIHKTISTLSNHVCIPFELPASVWADHIVVVGDFSQWCATATPLCQDRAGIWRATIDLPWGTRSEFRYLIDGRWQTDDHADGFAGGPDRMAHSVVYALLPNQMLSFARSYSQGWDNLTVSSYQTYWLLNNERDNHG
jgi:1,4-alpha-glucan branching enzyme